MDKLLIMMSQQRPWPIEVISILDETGFCIRVIYRGVDTNLLSPGFVSSLSGPLAGEAGG
jgi:hypothetical protein